MERKRKKIKEKAVCKYILRLIIKKRRGGLGATAYNAILTPPTFFFCSLILAVLPLIRLYLYDIVLETGEFPDFG